MGEEERRPHSLAPNGSRPVTQKLEHSCTSGVPSPECRHPNLAFSTHPCDFWLLSLPRAALEGDTFSPVIYYLQQSSQPLSRTFGNICMAHLIPQTRLSAPGCDGVIISALLWPSDAHRFIG